MNNLKIRGALTKVFVCLICFFIITIIFKSNVHSGWKTITIDSGDDVGSYTSLAFDQFGNPGVSYHGSELVAYGTTVITHGFRIWGAELPEWTFTMADAILRRAGKGRIWKYDEQNESFVFHDVVGLRSKDGEHILIFD